MLQLAAGFTILGASIAGVAALIASAVLAFVEHAKPAWRYRTSTKVAISLSICYGSNLFVYCAEIAPSLLFGGPVYGHNLHVAAGWVSLTSHYASMLHIFLLTILKTDILYDSDRIKYGIPWLSNMAIIALWIVAGGLSGLIMDRACCYTFNIYMITYQCQNPVDSIRLLIVYITLSGSILLISAALAVYRYFSEPVKERKRQNRDWQLTHAQDLVNIRKNWSLLLGNELMLAGVQLVIVAVTIAMSDRMANWHGLVCTVFFIICEILALWLYFRALTKSLQVYVRIEEARRRHGRSVSFMHRGRRCRSHASVGSRHSSCKGSRSSVRKSNREFSSKVRVVNGRNRVMPLDANTLEHTVASSARGNDAIQAWHVTDNRGDMRPVPIVQVQVYRGYEDDGDSLRNYCSDSDCDSLKERSASMCQELLSATTSAGCSPRPADCECPNSSMPMAWQHSDGGMHLSVMERSNFGSQRSDNSDYSADTSTRS